MQGCGYQSPSIVGSVMEHTKLALTTWFLAMFWMTPSKSGIGALPLMRHLGVGYPSAWLIRHKLMQVMFEREQATVLSGRIEIDDAFLGGEQPGRQGQGGSKVPFLAAVETDLKGRPKSCALNEWTIMASRPSSGGQILPSPPRVWCSPVVGRVFNNSPSSCSAMSRTSLGTAPRRQRKYGYR